ncbi:MAG: glutamate--tRNA ligase [Candidatus Marinimicrobia bacterium]|nr:glutamate--tRNA ligase [Candidatus Neomarinimicrobiota bacterium]
MNEIRTRFAPSPTGYLHVGGLRTALYNYLYARQNNGKFILRIEDTDQNRKVDKAVENLIESLRWAGLEIDEGPGFGGAFGPYIQSERTELYRQHVTKLLEKGDAYRCFCTPERLAKVKEQNPNSGYDRHCRYLSDQEIKDKMDAGEAFVIRQKIPENGEIKLYDIVRGEVVFPFSEVDDQVLLKSDGFPTYHLANVIDDHYMQISHVIRGEEWLMSTPKHLLLYESFAWKAPKFAHLSLLLNSDKSKLSKRQGDVSVEDYRSKGYLKEALVNFLALLGWNPGTNEEIFSMDQLMKKFSLKKVSKSGSIFDTKKLDWMNGQYIRALSPEEFYALAIEYFPKETPWSETDRMKMFSLYQQRISRLDEIPEKVAIFTHEFPPMDNDTVRAIDVNVLTVLKVLRDLLVKEADFDQKIFVEKIQEVQKITGIKGKELWTAVRIGVAGQIHGAEINIIAEILGQQACLKRIEKVLHDFAGNN